MGTMDRRTFLGTTGGTLSTLMAGCIGEIATDGTRTPDPPWTPVEATEPPDGTHHLYVENHTSVTETAWIRVLRDDGGVLVDGRYELPDERGIKFESIAAWEQTYTIEIAIDGEDVVSRSWQTTPCDSGTETGGKGGSRNAVVRVTDGDSADEPNRITFVVDQCDALHAPGVPVGSADYFRLDE